MKEGTLEKIIEVLDKGNPENYFINNNGLAALGAILFYPKEDQIHLQQLYKRKLQHLFKDNFRAALESLRRYHFSSFYTPKEIIDFQINLLKQNKINPKRILEPSAGNGAYAKELQIAFPDAQIVCIEPDYLSHAILASNFKNNDNVTCINGTFESFYKQNKERPTFDLVISNIPFGDINIKQQFDHDYLEFPQLKNVNLYFNFYAKDLLIDQGHAFILTSQNYCNRPSYNEIREKSLLKSNLIDVFRFNNMLFKNENTQVITDLIIYQKDSNKTVLTPKENLFVKTDKIEVNTKSFNINRYVNDTKKTNINGELTDGFFFNTPSLKVIQGKVTLSEFLKNHLKRENLLLQSAPVNTDHLVSKESEKKIISPKVISLDSSSKKSKEITISDKAYLKTETRLFRNSYNFEGPNNPVYYKSNTSVKHSIKLNDFLVSYINIKNKFILLELNSKNNLIDQSTIKKRYNELYNDLEVFHFQYGFLNSHYNEKILDKDSSYDYISRKLESYTNKNSYTIHPDFKASYFTDFLNIKQGLSKEVKNIKPSLNPEIEPTDLQTIAYNYFNLNGALDIESISNSYKSDISSTLEEGLQNELFYLDPTYNDDGSFNSYQTKLYHQVISGDLQKKIDTYESVKSSKVESFSNIVNLLNSKKNEVLSLDAIEFNFESDFVPKIGKTDFLNKHLSEPIDFFETQFSLDTNLIYKREQNTVASELYDVVINNYIFYNYKKLLHDFANNKFPQVYQTIKHSDGSSERILHKEATLIAQNKYVQLQLEFKSFISNNEKYKKLTEDNYYNRFLNTTNISPNSNILSFPKTLINTPYDHQNAAVLYGLSRGTALYDHQVGHGKSLTMAMLSSKLLKFNKAKRILISTLKSVASSLEREVNLNFPDISTFLLNENNFSSKNASKTLERIYSNPDIKIIICEHTHLLKIPKSIDYQKAIFEEKLEMIDLDLENAKSYGLKESKQVIKGLLKRKDSLESKLQNRLKDISKKNEDNRLTLQELEIDCLMVDEVHKFKNIGYSTRHKNVSGLNSPEDRKSNLDLEITIRSIHDRVNQDKNIFFFSGTPIKNSVTEVYAYQRYLTPFELIDKKINNFDSWASIFLKQSVETEPDILGNPRQHKRFRYFTNLPELTKMYHSFTHISNQSTFKTHQIEVKPEFVVLEPTENLLELREKTVDFTKNKNQKGLFGFDKYDEKKLKANYITGLNLNRKCLVDPLLEQKLTIDFSEKDQIKIQRLCSDVAKRYKETEKHKGVCLIFSDIGVFKKNEYNSYDTIRNILHTTFDIPLHEIQFAQENKGIEQKKQFQKNIREGNIRVAIGSTQVLGTGTNIQDRVVGIYGLDIPYSPDSDEQQIGRGARAGNVTMKHYNNILPVVKYGIKNTSDIFSYSLNRHKKTFIKQLKKSNPTLRTYDNILGDEDNLSYAQMEASLIGDMDAFKINQLKSKLNSLDLQEKLFNISKNNAQIKIERFENENKKIISLIGKHKKFISNFEKIIPSYNSDDKLSDIKNRSFSMYKNFTHLSPEHINFESLSAHFQEKIGALIKQADYDNKIKILSLREDLFSDVKYNDGLYFRKDYNSALKKTGFTFQLVYNNTVYNAKQQYKFNLSKLPFILFKTIKKQQDVIPRLESDFNFNIKTIELNKRLLTHKFPVEKSDKILELKKDIKKIKRKIG